MSYSEPGIAVSGAVHLALLLTMILAFANAKKFDDAQESIAVEVVTDSQFNEVMKGEKTAPAVKANPQPRAEKVADITDTKPTPPINEAKRDVAAPPSKPIDPGKDDRPEPPKPVASLPPVPASPSPDPSPPQPPKRAAEPEREAVKPVDAEAVEPPVRPKSDAKGDNEAKPAPEPPKKIRPAEKPPDSKPVNNPLAQVTKLLEQKKLEELTKAEPKTAKPRSTDEQVQHKYDATAISKLLSRELPQQMASSAHDLNHTASLGTATGSAIKMSPSLMGQLDEYMIEQYKRCWNPVGLDTGRYMPKISVKYNLDGSLAGEPRLLNPSADPASRAVAESALRAVHICNPLNIPPQFQPYYQEWKDRTLSFNPEDFL